jgi:mannose-1-phosphate guanylyltransferase/mannose-6-phosphate isomerase
VILAGGDGTRLWPLARRRSPKPFLPLQGGASLFRGTFDRIAPLVGASRIVVVTNARDVSLVRAQAPRIPRSQILAEGTGRDTATSIALAAHWLRRKYGDAIMIVLPADHAIRPAPAFRAALRRGVAAVRRTGRLLTIGVPAASPETGFGYILPAGNPELRGVRDVRKFVEKPGFRSARRMARSGRYLWNCGIFIWKASTILEELARHRPDIAVPIESWARRAPLAPWTVPSSVLETVPRAPIDRAVLEHSRIASVLRATFGWSDVGNWDALATLLGADDKGGASIGKLVTRDARRCLAVNEGGVTVFVGVEDLVAVYSQGALLVCKRDAAQKVRQVVRDLRRPFRMWL